MLTSLLAPQKTRQLTGLERQKSLLRNSHLSLQTALQNSPWAGTAIISFGPQGISIETGTAGPLNTRESRVTEPEARSAWTSFPSDLEREYYPHSSGGGIRRSEKNKSLAQGHMAQDRQNWDCLSLKKKTDFFLLCDASASNSPFLSLSFFICK